MKRPHSHFLEDVIFKTPPAEVDLGGSTPPFPFGIGFFNDVNMNLQLTGQMSETTELKSLLAQKLGVLPKHLALSVGSSMAMTQVLAAIADPGDTILIESPRYVPFFSQSRFLNLKVRDFERTGDEDKDLKTLRRQRKGAKILLLSNPHSPLGHRYSAEFLKRVCELFKYTIVDEVFEPLFSSGSLTQVKGSGIEGLITLHSFSKSIGLGNLRLGVIRGPAKVIHNCALQATNFHIDVPNLSVLYGLHAMKHWELIIKNLDAKMSLTRPHVQEFALSNPKKLSHDFSRGFFGMLKAPAKFKTGEKFSEYVLKKSAIYLRPGHHFGLTNSVRFHLFLDTSRSAELWNFLASQY